jgi:hypothetical protein
MSRIVLSLALSVLSASAQLSTAVNELGDGRSQVTITSTSGVPLEAFVATWITPEPSGGHRTALTYNDALFQFGVKRVPPGVPTPFIVGGADTQIQVQAGIFQDGSTYGDPQWIEGLRKHRVYYLQALDAFLAELRTASPTTSQVRLVQQLSETRDRLIAAATNTIQSPNSETPNFSDMFLRNAPGRSIRLVYTVLVRNITKPPAQSNGAAMALPDVLTMLIDLLNAQRSKVAPHVASNIN